MNMGMTFALISTIGGLALNNYIITITGSVMLGVHIGIWMSKIMGSIE